MNTVLITAIGSMSAPTILESLSAGGNNRIVGTDIYPEQWQGYKSFLSKFHQVPKAVDENYIGEILRICIENQVEYIIPLTDPEVDVLSENRELFEAKNIVLCISNKNAISKCRDKSMVETIFKKSGKVPVIESLSFENMKYPVIAKPKKGRSSEGLFLLKNERQLSLADMNDYIFQPYINGCIFTVDIVRDKKENCVSIPRQELTRTSNGAGITVEVKRNYLLEQFAKTIVGELNILGCVNIEFIFDGKTYYLMDINPRFSAGIGFSCIAGYDFITNHLKCFQDDAIAELNEIREGILSRKSQIVYI
jgi:carbamoyl-phosphate synthase large subunit